MSWAAAQNRIEAERKRDERAALKRQKELERRLKEQTKLSAKEQARLEVDTFENSLEVLLSVHKEASPPFDWMEPLCSLQPHAPMNLESADFQQERAEWEKMRSLAKRVLAGDGKAYGEALTEFSAFGELSALGSALAFRVPHAKLIECEVKVNGRDAIPADVKSLTAAGKVAVKSMPKARFHELYQDYVCGCALRVAREVLALLPVETVVVTATVDAVQASTGQNAEIAVLSVAMPRHVVERLDFARLDASDSMENFAHRGDVMASRKSGDFVAIVPLKQTDIANDEPASLGLVDVLARVREVRAELSSKLKRLQPEAETNAQPNPLQS